MRALVSIPNSSHFSPATTSAITTNITSSRAFPGGIYRAYAEKSWPTKKNRPPMKLIPQLKHGRGIRRRCNTHPGKSHKAGRGSAKNVPGIRYPFQLGRICPRSMRLLDKPADRSSLTIDPVARFEAVQAAFFSCAHARILHHSEILVYAEQAPHPVPEIIPGRVIDDDLPRIEI